MENEANPLAATQSSTTEATAEARARRELAVTAPALTKTLVVDAIRPLLARGWVCFQDLYRPDANTQPVSFVLVGPGGTVILDTASSMAAEASTRLAAGAGVVAATLAPAHRASVRSTLVVPGESGADAQAAAAGVQAVALDGLESWLLALPHVLADDAVGHISDALREQLGSENPHLLSTADLLPVSEGASDADLHRPLLPRPRRAPSPRPPAQPRRMLRRGRRDGDATSREERRRARDGEGRRRREEAPSPEQLDRPQMTLSDVIRVFTVSVAVLVAIWFWGVVSGTVTGEGDRAPLGGPVAVTDTHGSPNHPSTAAHQAGGVPSSSDTVGGAPQPGPAR